MDERKICFIWNVRDEKKYRNSLQHIEKLMVPEGYTVDTVVVSDKNVAKAYNQAMLASDAKYKIYLQDSVLVLNEKFIINVLEFFKDDTIGMLGILGATTIPTSGFWHDSRHKIGKKYVQNAEQIEMVSFVGNEQESYTEVKALDKSILITQYDIPWREDMFIGDYFYESSQCVEFSRKGYKTVVPHQEEPWCLSDMMNISNEDEFMVAKEIFVEEYAKDIYPLVSVLIPAYNRPEYIIIALESVLQQTYKNIEIIIGDDSTNEEVKEVIQPYLSKYPQITYFYNGGPLGEFGYKNTENIFKHSRGEYINLLMDDDMFHLEKIRSMMEWYLQEDNIRLVTSHRQLVDASGNPLPDISATRRFVDETKIIDGKELGKFMINRFLNIVGEPTTVLIRREDIDGMFGVYLGHQYKCLVDISQWLEVLRKGNAVYIADTLSYFRWHEGQNQKKHCLLMQAFVDSFKYINDSYQHGYFIESEKEYAKLVSTWLKRGYYYTDKLDLLKEDKNFNEQDYSLYIQYIKEAEDKLIKNLSKHFTYTERIKFKVKLLLRKLKKRFR